MKACSNTDCDGQAAKDYCPRCKRHLRDIDKHPLAWRLHRREMVKRWDFNYALSIPQDKKVIPLRRARVKA